MMMMMMMMTDDVVVVVVLDCYYYYCMNYNYQIVIIEILHEVEENCNLWNVEAIIDVVIKISGNCCSESSSSSNSDSSSDSSNSNRNGETINTSRVELAVVALVEVEVVIVVVVKVPVKSITSSSIDSNLFLDPYLGILFFPNVYRCLELY